MPCKRIIVVTTYHLEADDVWDIWEPLVLKHSLEFFLALWKACKASKKLCFLVIFLQLRESQPHISDIGIRTFKSHFGWEKVPEIVQLRKDSHFVYEDLVEKRELTRLVCQKTRYSGQRGLQAVQNFDILGVEGIFFLCTSLKVLRQGISSSVSFVLTIVNSKVVAKEFLGPADLSGAQTLCFHKPMEVVVVGKYEHLMLRPF